MDNSTPPARSPLPTASGKLDAFEGIRGLASLAVVFGHLVTAFWPILYSPGHPWIEEKYSPVWIQVWFLQVKFHFAQFLAESPTRVLFDAQFAVVLFFLLSGFVLSLGYFRNPRPEIIASGAARRYWRLAAPATASVFLAYLVMSCGWMFNGPTVAYMDKDLGFPHQWLDYFFHFEPSARTAIRESLWETFFVGSCRYNANLWTMAVELPGSFLVYAFVLLFGSLRNRWAYYLLGFALLLLTAKFYMVHFLLGVMLADLYAINERLTRPFRLPGAAAVAVGLASAYAISVKPGGEYTILGTPVLKRLWYETYAAFAFIAATAFSPWFQRVFAWKPFVFLGKISFSLYLLHLIVICSLTSYVYLKLRVKFDVSHDSAALLASGTCVGFSLVASWVMWKLVDDPTIRVGSWVYRKWFKPVAVPRG